MAGSVGQYTQGWFPWMNDNGNTSQASGYIGLGVMIKNPGESYSGGGHWLDTGTWKIAVINQTASNRGIQMFYFDGVAQGAGVDTYSAGSTNNVYSEITGISVTTAGNKVFTFDSTTKNASSSNTVIYTNSIALIRTSGTASTPGGTDTPGYTWEHLPWMGVKQEAAGTWVKYQDSTRLGGGAFYNSTSAQNDTFNTDFWMDTGTFTYTQVYQTDSGSGITTIQIDGSSVGTIDGYAIPVTVATVSTLSGISQSTAGTKNLKWLCATKNASASQYQLAISSASWIRTGA